MRENKTKRALREGKRVVGASTAMGSPEFVELAGKVGFDFVLVDMEHPPTTYETAARCFLAADAAGVTPLVRVWDNHPALILRALDSGAAGVLVPHISTREDAERAVRACRYPPAGTRSIAGTTRATDLGLVPVGDHLRQANAEVMALMLLEDRGAVANLDAILDVSGIDAVLIGVQDLAADLGFPGQSGHAEVQRTAETMVARAVQRGVIVWMGFPEAKDAVPWIERGVRMVHLGGTDIAILARGLRGLLDGWRALGN